MLNSIRRFFGSEVKENPAYSAIISMALRGPQWTPANYASLADQGFVQNADAFSCINTVVVTAKGIKWKAYRRTDLDEPAALDTEHPLARLLRRPNPRMGWGSFFGNAIGYYEISGNSYIVRVGPDGKPPLELWPLRPDRTRVVVGTALNPIERYDYHAGSATVKLEPDTFGQTCLHIKSFHPLDDFYGLSPIQVAARNIDQSNAWQAWNVALGQNMARPSGALVSEGVLTDDQFEKLKDDINQSYSGFQNAGRPFLLSGGLKWQSIGLSPVDADWLAGDDRTTRKICAVYGVPPELIGMMSKGGLNDANFQQARKRLYLDTVLPLLDQFRDELNGWLAPMYGEDIFIDYVRDDIESIQEDREIIHKRARDNWESGLITRNEGRAMIGKDPDTTYGDVYLLPAKSQVVGPDAQGHATDLALVQPEAPLALPAPAEPPKKPAGKPAVPAIAPAVKPKADQAALIKEEKY